MWFYLFKKPNGNQISVSADTRAEILNCSAVGTSAKLLSSSLSLQGDARAVSRCLLMPSFSAFTGHLPCCRWRLMDPRGLMIPHFFLPQLWMAASRACCLSACGSPPYPSGRLLLTLPMAPRVMGRKFLSRGGALGSIPPSSSSVET